MDSDTTKNSPLILCSKPGCKRLAGTLQAHDTSVAILAEIVKPKLSRRAIQSKKLLRLRGNRFAERKKMRQERGFTAGPVRG